MFLCDIDLVICSALTKGIRLSGIIKKKYCSRFVFLTSKRKTDTHLNSVTQTYLYAASVLPLEDESLYRLAYDNASSDRRQKIDGFRFAKDRRLSLGADMLLQYALREANTEYDPARIKIGAYGKPSLEDMPLHFNISHAEDYVICAISACEIGCDIEKIRSADLRIAERFFCPEEYSHIASQTSAADRDLLFYRYWTLKESFIKATGMGLNLPFNEFCIELGEESLAEICAEIHAMLGEESPDKLGEDIHIRQSFDQRKYSFTEFSSILGYCCAVCTTGDQQNAELKMIDLSKM